ncbi:DAHL domain-containing protein, partial [Kaarinaea lacus]
MKITLLRLLLLFSALLLTFTTVYINSPTIDWDNHEQALDQLQKIHLLDALSNQELLKVRYSMFADYDQLSEHIKDMRAAAQVLQNDNTYFTLEEIQIAKTALQVNLQKKAELIEKFKSNNAILKNSLINFPTLVNETKSKLGFVNNQQSLINYVDTLLRDILLYSLINDDQLDKSMRERIENIENWRNTKANGIDKYLNNIMRRAQLIITKRHQINDIA